MKNNPFASCVASGIDICRNIKNMTPTEMGAAAGAALGAVAGEAIIIHCYPFHAYVNELKHNGAVEAVGAAIAFGMATAMWSPLWINRSKECAQVIERAKDPHADEVTDFVMRTVGRQALKGAVLGAVGVLTCPYWMPGVFGALVGTVIGMTTAHELSPTMRRIAKTNRPTPV
jgi:hypothetical protein